MLIKKIVFLLLIYFVTMKYQYVFLYHCILKWKIIFFRCLDKNVIKLILIFILLKQDMK